MRNSVKGKYIFLSIILVVAIGACAAGPQIIKLAGGDSMAGEVAFNHAKHVGSPDSGGYSLSCDRCHHSLRTGQVSHKCRTCHKKEASERTKPMEEVAHTTCMGCHEEHAIEHPSKKLPASCPDCHVYRKPSAK